MKNIKFLVSILLITFGFSCSDDNEEPEENYNPIELSRREMWVTHINTTDTIYILSGNGDYKIIEFHLNVEEKEEFAGIPPENFIKVYIEDNRIIARQIMIEPIFLAGGFVIVDAKGIREICTVSNPSQKFEPFRISQRFYPD